MLAKVNSGAVYGVDPPSLTNVANQRRQPTSPRLCWSRGYVGQEAMMVKKLRRTSAYKGDYSQCWLK